MDNYYDNLLHIAEPDPGEKEQADSIVLQDWTALWLSVHLRDFAHYAAAEPLDEIALGYAEYIDKKVRDLGDSGVWLYHHTDEAERTLNGVLTAISSGSDTVHTPLEEFSEEVEKL